MLPRLLRAPVIALAVAVASVLLVAAPSASAATGHRHTTRWDCLAHYESSHRWSADTGNGYYGGLQFSHRTWLAYGGYRYSHNYWPNKATRREQIVIARRVAWKGWGHHAPQGGRSAWPALWGRCF